jgi:hypothetical protein
MDVAVLELISHARRASLLRQTLYLSWYRAGGVLAMKKIVFLFSNDSMRYVIFDIRR